MEMTLMLPLLSLSVIFLIKGADTTTFTFSNKCSFTLWPATLAGSTSPQLSLTGFTLFNGSFPLSLDAPVGWSGRMWARRVCTTDSTGKFSCKSGDCGSGQVACNGAGGAPPVSLVEFTLNGNAGQDYYDVSLVDGFNLPVSITSTGGSGTCGSANCTVNIDSQCPNELQFTAGRAVLGCKSACAAFNTDQYCCRGAYNTAATCPPSSYAHNVKAACPHAYSYAYDDGTSTFTCTGATNYAITFCP